MRYTAQVPSGMMNHERASHLIAASSYFLMALCLWLPYGPSNGMSYETAFPWMSETTPFPGSLLYPGDELRIFTNVFYDLGYRLSQVLQIPGSYLGNQIVFLALMWARGYLLYLAFVSLVPEAPWLAFLSGAFALTHASDLAAMWVGQMNQLGYMFWLALAFYSLVRATGDEPSWVRKFFGALALLSCHLALYSYESPIFLISLIPLFLALIGFGRVKRNLFLFALWYIIPAGFAYRFIWRWHIARVATYQSGIMRRDFSISGVLSEWGGQVEHSFAFWNWGAPERQPEHAIYGYLAAAGFALSCLLFLRARGFAVAAHRKAALRALPFGLAVCVFSFPAYLFLSGGGGLWRTQFLSSFGTGIAMSALLVLAATVFDRRAALAVALLGAIVILTGVRTLVDTSKRHLEIWERYRRVMAQILVLAPRLQPGSVIVLSDVPKQADPFGDNMWFDLGVRLAYPGQAVAGIYFLRDGDPSPSRNLEVEAVTKRWKWNRRSIQPLVTDAPAVQSVFFELSEDGTLRLLSRWPVWLPVPGEVTQFYDPSRVIVRGEPSPVAANRYWPIHAKGSK